MKWTISGWLGRVAALCCAATLLQACVQTAAPLPASSAGSVTVADVYRLGPGDRFRLNVFNEPSLSSEEQNVSGDGSVSLPLIGAVPVAGLTIREAEKAIATKYADGFLTNPRVSLDMVAFRPFYILGEVKSPGEYPYADGLTILSAVAKAGGYTFRANETKVFIRHRGDAAEKELPIAADTPVLPGDTIRVPERFF